MRLVSYVYQDSEATGHLEDGRVWPIPGAPAIGPDSLVDLLREAPTKRADSLPVEAVRLLPVVPRPNHIFCVGLNYRSHIEETGRADSDYPVLFTKFASSLLGAGDPLIVPPESAQVDYEVEMAVVIGRPGRRIPRSEAMSHVAGYAAANDVTMRDYQYKTHQWLQGKAWERSTPVGPCLVTADEFAPDHVFTVSTTLNGESMQLSDTSKFIFDIPELISRISEFLTVSPGDIILTGTPGGVGFRRDPQIFLRPGDTVTVEVSDVGRITTEVRGA